MKQHLKIKAIKLRQDGLSYSEILKEVMVAKSTLSLWLRSVGLSKKQKQKLTLKKLQAAQRGGEAKRRQRIEKTKMIVEKAKLDIGEINKRELWLMGIMLYWAEGSKEKEYKLGSGVIFCNSDPMMINFYLKWLKEILVLSDEELVFEIYIHETYIDKVKDVQSFWSSNTGFPMTSFTRVYFKKNKILGNRKNTGIKYNGVLRIMIKCSSELNRRIAGWVEGVCVNNAESSNGRTLAFGARYSRSES